MPRHGWVPLVFTTLALFIGAADCDTGLHGECNDDSDCLGPCMRECEPFGVLFATCNEAEARCRECICDEPGTGGGGGAGGTAGTPGANCAPLGSRLLMVLDWEGADVELDLGGETPRDNEPGNNFGAPPPGPRSDPNCTHDGDEPHTSGMTKEQVVCEPLDTDPGTYAGTYTIRVDNFGSEQHDFDLLVTIDSADVPGFPRSGTVDGAIDGSAGFVHETFCLE